MFQVFAVGSGTNGELGNDRTVDSTTIVPVTALDEKVTVAIAVAKGKSAVRVA